MSGYPIPPYFSKAVYALLDYSNGDGICLQLGMQGTDGMIKYCGRSMSGHINIKEVCVLGIVLGKMFCAKLKGLQFHVTP